MGFPGCSDSKERPGFDPWVRKIPWRRAWLPTPVFLPGEFQGQRSLVGYSPWGCKESEMTKWLTLSLFIPKIVRFFPSYLPGILYLGIIHSELIFVESVKSVSRVFFFFSFLRLSSCSSAICWRNCLCSIVFPLLLYQRSDYIYGDLFLGSPFCSTDLFVSSLTNATPSSLVYILKVGKVSPPALFFSFGIVGYSGSFASPYKLYFSFFNF